MHTDFAEGTITHGRVWELKASAVYRAFNAMLATRLCNQTVYETADAIYELFVGIKAISPLSAEIDPTIPVAT